jgi:hypothetical protein
LLSDHPCKPEPVQSLVGRLLDEPTLATALRLSGASIDRVVRAGEPSSMDYVTSRLTIEVDGANRILGLYCS